MFIAGMLGSRADILVTIPSLTAVPGTTVTYPVKIYGAGSSGTPISACDIRFTFDTARLTYTGVSNFYAQMPANQWFYGGFNGLFSANWIEPNLNTVAIPDGTTLFEVKFTAKPGACPLPFSFLEFLDANYDNIPCSGQNGHYASIQQVTFQVDMRDQTVGAAGVQLAGSFNNWSPTATPMTNTGGSIYAATLSLISDSAFTYRFVNGNTTAGYEIVPAACGVPASGGLFNRSVTVPAGNSNLAAVCFGSCEPCPPMVNVSFRVDMSQQSINPQGVHVAGDFNTWNTSSHPMSNLGNHVFGRTIQAIPGTTLQFKYVNGNTAAGYELVPASCGVSGSGGTYNRYITIGNADTTLSEVCFSSCTDCPQLISLTLKVDMNETTVSPNGVHVAGSFNNFSPNATPMTNQGNNVFIATIDVWENDFVTYRFVNGNTTAGFEAVPEACGIPSGTGGFDRYLQMGTVAVIAPEVCFSSCTDCTGNPDEVAVTFKVDMAQQNIASAGVFLAASFNNWSTSANQMIHLGNKVYSATINLLKNTEVRYRFVNGNTAAGYETVPDACGTPGTSGGNERALSVPEQDIILPEVCFAMCEDCPPAQLYEITFRVDMSKQTVGVFGVYIAGDFNAWNPASTQLIYNPISQFYEKTLLLEQGTTVLYRYVNGNSTAGLELVPAFCGIPYGSGELARQHMVNGNAQLEGICFADCYPCDVSVPEFSGREGFGMAYPNPASQTLYIPVSVSAGKPASLQITDVSGRVVVHQDILCSPSTQLLRIDTSGLKPGFYLLTAGIASDPSERHTQRIIIIR